jgi:hypothetical protein
MKIKDYRIENSLMITKQDPTFVCFFLNFVYKMKDFYQQRTRRLTKKDTLCTTFRAACLALSNGENNTQRKPPKNPGTVKRVLFFFLQ